MSDHRKVIAIHYASGIDKSAKQPDGDGDSNEPSVNASERIKVIAETRTFKENSGLIGTLKNQSK